MQQHGALSPKPTVFMGNVRTMNLLNKGTLSAKEKRSKTKIKTTRIMSKIWFDDVLAYTRLSGSY